MYSCSLSISRHLRLTGSRLQHSLNFFSFPVSLYFSELCPPMGRPNFCPRRFCVQVPHGYVGKSSRVLFVRKGKKECQYLRLYIISQLIFSFTVSRMTFFNIHAFSILITSINLLPKREISDTINVSPFFILFNSTPSFLSLLTVFLKPFLPPTHQFGNPLFGINDLSRTAGFYSLFIS